MTLLRIALLAAALVSAGCVETQISRLPAEQDLPDSEPPPNDGPPSDLVTDSNRRFGWTLDERGFTQLPEASDSRRIYVSSSRGADSNDGSSETRALRSIAAARRLVRDGFPDRLLLRAGDTFSESIAGWGLSGRSPTAMMVIGAYCEAGRTDCGARPRVRANLGLEITPASATATVGNLAVVGLAFEPLDYTGSQGYATGIHVKATVGSGLLFEDCFVRGYTFNVNFNGAGVKKPNGKSALERVALRRSIVVDAYVTDANDRANYGQGMRVSNVNGLLLEENVFDHNGWREAAEVANAPKNGESHNVHLSESNEPEEGRACESRSNLILNAGSDGLQSRCNGLNVIENNLFVRNAIALTGINTYIAYQTPIAWHARIRENVVLEGTDINSTPGGYRTWGFALNPPAAGTRSEISGNVIAHRLRLDPNSKNALSLNCNGSGGARYNDQPIACLTTTKIERNVVFDWEPGPRIDGAPAEALLPADRFVDPTRGIPSYLRAILVDPGTDGLKTFASLARARARGEWKAELAAPAAARYVREGFKLKP